MVNVPWASTTLGGVGDNPEPRPVYLNPSAEAASSASMHLTTPVYLEAAAAAVSGASPTVSVAPLLHLGSAAIYPSADGGNQLVIARRPDSPVPSADVTLGKNSWDLATLSFGFTVGYGVGRLPGGIIGAAGFCIGGRLRWRWVQRNKP
jgi:hypothetical protein